MRFVIINTDYPEFLGWLYARHPGLEEGSYSHQMRVRSESLFGVADFYSHGLRAAGHEAWEIHANNESLQCAWAREHGTADSAVSQRPPRLGRWLQHARRVAAGTPLRRLKPLFRPFLRLSESAPAWFYRVLRDQIMHYRPDVILCQAMTDISGFFLQDMRPHVRAIVGQHPWPHFVRREYLGAYDLVISSMSQTVELFRSYGVEAELHHLGFGETVLHAVDCQPPEYDITFIGSFAGIHTTRIKLLEAVQKAFPQLRIWAPHMNGVPAESTLRRAYVGQAWGRDVYRILRRSRIALNHHGEASPSANNMRLYEATGVGTFLLTDWKANLGELFEPDREVAAYRSETECIDKIGFYLEHESERSAVAARGQQRTLRDHTYVQRMRQFVDIVERRI